MKKDFQDSIDKYILGRMSDEEKTQFESEVNQDASKKEQLEFTKNVKNAIGSREDKLAKMKMMQRKYEQEYQQVAASIRPTGTDGRCYAPDPRYAEKKSSKRIWWWASGIAAVLVIGLFVVNPFVICFSPIGSSPNEIIRGEENDVFDTVPPMINDSTGNDTIPHDTTNVVKGILDKINNYDKDE